MKIQGSRFDVQDECGSDRNRRPLLGLSPAFYAKVNFCNFPPQSFHQKSKFGENKCGPNWPENILETIP